MYSFSNRRMTARWLALFFVVCIWLASTTVPTPSRNSLPVTTGQTLSAPARPAPVRKPIAKAQPPNRPKSDLLCLAQVIYFEAGFEPLEGIEAVAATVFHRTDASTRRRSVCSVVYAPSQFSWTADWSKWSRKPAERYFELAKEYLAKRDDLRDTYQVSNFHHVGITPKWASNLEYVATYGQHKFYRPKLNVLE